MLKLTQLTLDCGFLLTSLPNNTFVGLSQLQELHLIGKLTYLPEGLFSGLSQLQYLDLGSNQLNNLPAGLFAGLSQLQYLGLWGNQLDSLPAGLFSGLSQLKDLYLDGNQLNNLPAGLFAGLSQLQYLDLEDNQLNNLPTDLFLGLSELQELFLGFNYLDSLSAGLFSDLSQLQYLSLARTQLNSFPADLFVGLSQLKSLYLDENQIDSLPEGLFSKTLQLQFLSLRQSHLNDLLLYNLSLSLPASIEDLYLVNNPKITNQGLKSLAAIFPCTQLKKIYLRGDPRNVTMFNLQLQLKKLKNFCESERCHSVWPTEKKSDCQVPKPSMNTNTALPRYFRTRTNEPPCFYKDGGTNLVAAEKQPDVERALLPECQFAKTTYAQRLALAAIGTGLFSCLSELPRETLKIAYPNNRVAQGIRSALLIVPMLAFAYAESSCRTPVMSVSSMMTFSGLKMLGMSNRLAYVGMLTMTMLLGLWFLSPRNVEEVGEALSLFGLTLFIDSVSRYTMRKATQWSFGFFQSKSSVSSINDSDVQLTPIA